MKKLCMLFFYLTFYYMLFGQNDGRGYGFITVNFENRIKNYQSFDSIYGAEAKERIIKYCEHNLLYPKASLDYCIEGTVLIGFDINRASFTIDTSTVRIISSADSILDNKSISFIKNLPVFVGPGDDWKFISDTNAYRFAISFNYKLLDCFDPLWRDDVFPENGKYTGYYKKGTKRVEGFYKNGQPDSLWIFYDYEGNTLQRGYCKKCRYQMEHSHIYLASLVNFNGIKNGVWEYYDKNGRLKATQQYLCGVPFGSQIFYDSTGNITGQYFYNNYSDYTYYKYDSVGNILQTRTFETTISFFERFKRFFYRVIKKGYFNSINVNEKAIEFTYYETRVIETKIIRSETHTHWRDKTIIEYWRYSAEGNPIVYTKSKNERIIREKKFK